MSIPSAQHKSPLLVAAAVIIEKGEALITRRPEHKPHGGLWEFPGGKLNPGESPVEALQRELREELAIEIRVGQIIDALFHRYDWGPVLVLAYHCRKVGGTLCNIEVTEHKWVPLEELHQYELLAADIPLVAKLQGSTTDFAQDTRNQCFT